MVVLTDKNLLVLFIVVEHRFKVIRHRNTASKILVFYWPTAVFSWHYTNSQLFRNDWNGSQDISLSSSISRCLISYATVTAALTVMILATWPTIKASLQCRTYPCKSTWFFLFFCMYSTWKIFQFSFLSIAMGVWNKTQECLFRDLETSQNIFGGGEDSSKISPERHPFRLPAHWCFS